MSSIAALASVLAILGSDVKQDPQASSATPTLPDVLVTTTREEAVLRYVDALPDVSRATEPLARFDRQVCVQVVNLTEGPAQAVKDRIDRTALDAGLSIGGPGCTPSIVVVFSLDGDASAAEHRRTAPWMFDRIAQTRRAGRTQLREFLRSDQPVRWWHATQDVPAGGEIILPGIGDARSRMASLLSGGSSKMEIHLALVIVDMNRIEAVDLNALADYAAFVALAQIDPSAEVAASDTILNLFDSGSAQTSGLSDMDRSYLRGLYRLTDETKRAAIQQGELAYRILRDLRQDE